MKLNYTELTFLVNLVNEECKRAKKECMVKLDAKVLEVVAEWNKHPEWTAKEKQAARDIMTCHQEEEYHKACNKLALAERLYEKLTKEDFEMEVNKKCN